MNSTYVLAFKRLNLSTSFRKIMAYVLIFSLFWQNSLWANQGLYTLEEELGEARVRTYNNRRAGIVEPGTIRDTEIHNVFEDLQLWEEGGVVFTGAPGTTKIYNRIYSADPIELSGVIEADFPLPMVFANPGGIILENPDFQNITDLTLAAGALAQTNEGMAYGVNDGSLVINKTFIQEENDVKNLALAGRGIHINQSFLSPAASLILRAGQHIKGWHNEGEWISEDDMALSEISLLGQDSILLEESSILRSKGLYLESLEEGASIRAHGLLQSTEEDINIRAKGDVYVDKLFAHRNIKIKTTGKVFLGSQIFAKGAVKIKAEEIINQGKLIGTEKITFEAPRSINEGFIQTQGLLDPKNLMNMAQGQIEAKSLNNALNLLGQNRGTIEIQDDLMLDCGKDTLKGTIKTHGRIEASGQELTIDGNVCAQNGIHFNILKKLTNTRNATLSVFGAGLQGTLKEFENQGKMDLSSANAQIGKSTNNKGSIIRTAGHSALKGDHHFNYGTIFTCGVHQTVLTGTYKDNGSFYSPTLFLLEARDIDYTDSQKSFFREAVIRATAKVNAGENVSFMLNGNQMPCFLQLSSKGNLTFRGKIRHVSSSQQGFPLLDYFQIFGQPSVPYAEFAKKITCLSLASWKQMRQSFGEGITLQAAENIDMNSNKASIDSEGSSVNLVAEGKISTNGAKIKSGGFTGNNAAIRGKMALLNNTQLSSLFGTTSIVTQESTKLGNSMVDGYLSANVSSKDIDIDGSTVGSSHGLVTIQGSGNIKSNNSSFDAFTEVFVRGKNIEFDSSTMKSKESSTQLDATKTANINHSSFKAKSLASLMAEDLSLDSSRVKSKESFVRMNGTNSATINNSHVNAKSLASLMSTYIKFSSSRMKSARDNVRLEAQGLAELNNADLDAHKRTTISAFTLKMNKSKAIAHRGESVIRATTSARIEDSEIIGTEGVHISAQDLKGMGIDIKSTEGKASIQASAAALDRLQMESKTGTSINASDLILKDSQVKSEANTTIHATKSASLTAVNAIGTESVHISAPDLKGVRIDVKSPEGKASIQASAADLAQLRMEGKTGAAINASDLILNNARVDSGANTTIHATKSASLTDVNASGNESANIIAQNLKVKNTDLSSADGTSSIHASAADLERLQMESKKGTAINASDLILKDSQLSSEANTTIHATKSASLTDVTASGTESVHICASDLKGVRIDVKSPEGKASIQASIADLERLRMEGKTGAAIDALDLILKDGQVSSEANTTIHATKSASLTDVTASGTESVHICASDLKGVRIDVKSPEGKASIQASIADLERLRMEGKTGAAIDALDLILKDSQVMSEANTTIHATTSASLTNVNAIGIESVHISAPDLKVRNTEVISTNGQTSIQASTADLHRLRMEGKTGAAINGLNLFLKESHIKSEDGESSVQAKYATITDSDILAKLLVSIMGEDVSLDSSTLTSHEDGTRIHATGTAKITNTGLLAKYLASINGKNVSLETSTLTSQEDKVQLQATHTATVTDSGILGRLLASVSGEDVSFDASTLTSQQDSAYLQATHSAKGTGSKILGKLLTAVIGDDVTFTSSTLKSQDDVAHLEATNSLNVKGSQILAQLLAFVGAEDVSFDSSTLTSQKDKARIQAANTAKVSASIILARSLASIVGTAVTVQSSALMSQEDVALIAATNLATLLQSTLKGKTTVVDGGNTLTLTENNIIGGQNHFMADHIKANSNKTKGATLLKAKENLEVHRLKAEGGVTALAPTMHLSDIGADSLHAQGNHIKIEGALVVEKFLNLIGKTIEQFGTTKAGQDSSIEATEKYSDDATSRNEAGGTLFLISEHTTRFKGHQKAGDTLAVKLKDMNLFDLLNQTEARITKAHLTEAEVKFDEDFVLDRTLHLWGKSLENKKKFTATKDFIAHMQTLIMNQGSMVAQGNMALESKRTVANFGLMEAANLDIKGKTVLSESVIKRKAIPGGYRDGLTTQATMRARTGNLNVEATESLQARGSKFQAKLNVNLKSAGKLYLGAQQLASEVSTSGKRSKYHSYTLNNHKTQIDAGQNVDITSTEGMIFEGLDVRAAGYIHANSEGPLENRTVHNVVHEESHKESKSGTFKKKKKKDIQSTTETVQRNQFQAGEDVSLESEGNNIQHAPHMASGGATTIRSNQGKVIIKADKSSSMTSTNKSGKSLVWQSQQQKGRHHETVEMLEILAKGGVHISGAQGVEAEIRGGQSKLKTIDFLAKHAKTEWVKELRKDPKTTWHLIAEEHKKWNKKSQGLTAPAGAALLLAISIATAGSGAALAGLAAGTLEATFASAAFTSLVSQASLSLINNQGDIGKVFKDMGSKENLKSLATSVASAGITHGLSDQLNLPTRATTFTDHLQKSLVSSGTSAGLNILIHKQDVREALLQAAKGVACATIGGTIANNIGAAYGEGDLNWVTHKLAHGALGAFTGAIIGDDPGAGALAGALGGMVSEIIAEVTLPRATESAMDHALKKAKSEGRALAYQDVREALAAEVNNSANVGRMGAALAALALNQDVNIATSAATTAVDNNLVPLVLVGLSLASVLYSCYEVYDAYDKEGGGEAGAKAALEELALQGAINAAGGAVGKSASIALKVVLAKNPMLAMVFSKASLQLDKVVDAAANTKLGQKIAKLEVAGGRLIGKVEDRFGQVVGTNNRNITSPVSNIGQAQSSSTSINLPKVGNQNVAKILEEPLSYWNRVDAHTFKGQTNRVYKRDDLIDPLKVDDYTGLTNLQLMKQGRAPIGLDGKPLNLHHSIQIQDGALVEMTKTFHQQHSKIIHINPSTTPSGIDRDTFKVWRSNYWKERAKDFK